MTTTADRQMISIQTQRVINQLSTLEWAIVVFQSAQHKSTRYVQAIDLAQSLKQMKRLQAT